jgi:S1-C subfamily serine protease
MDDLFRLLDKKQFGETVQLEVYRGGNTVKVPVKLSPMAGNATRTRRAN